MRPAELPMAPAHHGPIDVDARCAWASVMEVRLNAELQAKVERAAAENQSDPAQYVEKLVENYVEHDAWFRQNVKKGLEQLDRGEFITHEEIGARIEKMFRP